MRTPDRSTIPGDWTLAALLARAALRADGNGPVSDIKITSLTDDSRAVRRGSCFVAVSGTTCDGHRFVETVVEAGAAAVVVERDIRAPRDVIVVKVDDTRAALAKLAAAFYGLTGNASGMLRLVGITGTNGKTTTAWLLRSILHAAGHRTALIGTIEYDLVTQRRAAGLTTPGSLDLCRDLATARSAEAAYGILEVSSHALDQRRTDGLMFTAGVFTNLSGDHLDYHGTMGAYLAAKRRLFEGLDRGAVAIVNGDDPVGKSIASASKALVVTFGLDSPRLDVSARIRALDSSGSTFVLKGRAFETDVSSPLIGRHNVMNVLAAAATAEALGVAPEAVCEGIESGTGGSGVPGRLQRVEPEGCPFSVLVDYAHTDDALRNVLEALRPLTAGRLICVFGCGGDRDRAKRPRMAAAVDPIADIAYVTSDNPRTEDPQKIINEILPGFGSPPNCRVEVQVDRRRAIQAAVAEARSGDTVLIAGKGHENYQLVGDKVLSFDDAEEARACLETKALIAEEAA